DFQAYLPFVVLAEVLTDGDASRLVERLVQRDRTVTSIGGYIGFMGDEFQVRNPTAMLIQAHMPPGRDTEAVLGRALPMAVLELQRGRPEMLNELPKLIGEVTEAQIAAAAATLRPERRATVEVLPGATA